jgi:hypothetical protein
MRRLLPFLVAFAAHAAACGPVANKSGVYPRYGGTRSSALIGGGYFPGGGTSSSGAGLTGSSLNSTTATSGGLSTIIYNGTNPVWAGEMYRRSAGMDCWTDDVEVGTGAQSSNLSASTISTGSFTITAGSDLHPSVWTYSTSAGAAAGGRIYTNETGYALSATDITTIKWIVALRSLDDGTDTYEAWFGSGDNGNTINVVDGFGFIYAKTTAPTGGTTSPNWQIYAIQNSTRSFATLDGTNGTVNSVVNVGDMSANTGTIYNLMVSGTTSRLDYCIGDTDSDGYCHAANAAYTGQPISTGWVGCAAASGCPMTAANIPAAGTARTWGLKAEILKTAATALPRIMDVDLAGYCRPFSSPR